MSKAERRTSPSERQLVTAVLTNGPVSRQELMDSLGLSAPSLTRLSKPLVDAGVFIETEAEALHAKPQAGRPPKGYDINEAFGTFIGMKLTGSEIFGALTTMRARPLKSASAPLKGTSPGAIAAQIADLARQLSQDEGAAPLGIGVCLGGQVDDRRTVLRNPYLGWRNVPLADLIEDQIGLSATVENDVTALAEGSLLFGSGAGKSDFVLITIGTGVGYGLVVGGRVMSTSDTGLGLGGHIPLDSGGPFCLLGHRGCADAMLTFRSITAQISAAQGQTVDLAAALSLARGGDPLALAVFDASAKALGRLIATAANLTMSSTVLLSGEGMEMWDLLSRRTLEEAHFYRDPDALPLSILPDHPGPSSWACGAAASAIVSSIDRLAAGFGHDSV